MCVREIVCERVRDSVGGCFVFVCIMLCSFLDMYVYISIYVPVLRKM